MRADLLLIGFGHVGRRFARLIDEQRETLRAVFDLECRVIGIATRNHGHAISDQGGLDAIMAAALIESGGSLSQLAGAGNQRVARHAPMDLAVFSACLERLASSDAALKVVVETTTLNIEDGRPAIDHVERALTAGCHVVTANKGPAAFAYRRLARMAAEANVRFLFEGAVMDGIPVFNLVRETLPAVSILGFRGVVNSTTNHILSALEEGEEFAPALARMQAAGIAEADPSLDVDGWDATSRRTTSTGPAWASTPPRGRTRPSHEATGCASLRRPGEASAPSSVPPSCRPRICCMGCAAWQTRSCSRRICWGAWRSRSSMGA
jgi:homoserine dehydrogenase